MKIKCPRLWQGGTAYIIGGGPSLKSVDLSLIKGKRIIGTNAAYTLGDWIDIIWFGDLKFWGFHKEKLREYPALVMTCNENTRVGNYAWVKQLRRGKSEGIDDRPNFVSWNRCTGSSAINLAYHLGVKRVVLLGFDMKPDGVVHPDGRPVKNWHDIHKLYETERMQKQVVCYARYLKCMPAIRKDADKLGLEIINTTTNSAITHFPFAELKEII